MPLVAATAGDAVVSAAGAGAAGAGAGAAGGGLLSSLGGSSLLGGILGGGMSLFGQSQANSANASLNQATMDWETQMSNTAVQRRAADMKAAGINPILAAGNPASQPSYSPLAMQSVGGAGAAGIASAAQAAQVANIQADTNVKTAQATQIANSTYDQGQYSRQTEAGINKETASAQNLDTQRGLIAQQIENAQADWKLIQSKAVGQDIGNETAGLLQQGLLTLQKLDIQSRRLGLQVTGAEAGGASLIKDGLDAIAKGRDAAASWVSDNVSKIMDYMQNLRDHAKERY